MKLLTKQILATLPALYSQEHNPDPMVMVKFFDPSGAATWYITEGSQDEGDFIMFGRCDLFGDGGELGNVSLRELESVRGRFGLGIERDIHWKPVPLSQCIGR